MPVSAAGDLLDAEAASNRGFDGLQGWMRKAEAIWRDNQGAKANLADQFNYYGKLVSQFPIAPLRVVYAASGTLPAACLLRDHKCVVEHILYWTPVASEAEGNYLTAVLNSETARARTEKYQSRGQFGARHFDKVIFNLPIPRFSPAIQLHNDIATAAERAETLAAALAIPEDMKFQRARGFVRAALADAGISQEIDILVARLLDGE